MRKKGSAIIAVIGCITVLAALTFAFIGSSREKKGISRLMSDEKKCEALAESANDFIIQYIKKNANNHEDNNPMAPIYYLLRAPLKVKTAGADGANHDLDVSDTKELELETLVPYENVLNPTIEDIGWTGKVTVKSLCELCKAEAFSPSSDGYVVPTIDTEHLPAVGESAKFLDDINASCDEGGTDASKWKDPQWHLQVKFPEGDPKEEEVVYDLSYDGWLIDFDLPDIAVTIRREDEATCTFYIDIDFDTVKNFEVLGWKPFEDVVTAIENKIEEKVGSPIDVQKKLDESHFFPDIPDKTLKGLRDAYTIGGENLDYDFSTYRGTMQERMGQIDYSSCLNSGFSVDSYSDFGDPYYLEKGGILRITTTVTYNQSNSKTLERTLVTEIPFKASDVQPMAPEYSFFIANSKKVSDQGDIVDSSVILGDPISLNRDVSKAKADFYSDSPPAGQFIIHNIPSKNESTAVASIVKEKIDYTALDGTRIPGMVRVNCDYTPSNNKVTQIRSFFGIVGQPELTEFNKLMMPFNDMKGDLKNNFDTIVSFCWEDRDGKRTPAKRYHDIELPVIFDTDCGVPTPQEPGIKHIIDFVKSSGFQIISVPTLLFGTCHMEYPLGLVAEGPIDTIFSRTRVFVKLHGELSLLPPDFDELSEVSYNYENVTNYANSSENAYAFDGSDKPESRDLNRASGFGMTGAKTSPICGYNKNQPWSCNDDPKYCPANCYDTLQYVKKATKYYESEKEFLADLDKDVAKGGLLGEGGYKEFHGVYYVKCETLNLGTFKYKGNGLIVSKSDIIIKGNITRDDNDTTSTLGIISRNGSLEFKGGAEKIMASCFSNNPPRNSSPKLSIYGNLVCNTFKRDSFGVDTYIYYNNSINSVTPFALHRKVGKFEPKRYAVAFADNWSKFSYEQKKEE